MAAAWALLRGDHSVQAVHWMRSRLSQIVLVSIWRPLRSLGPIKAWRVRLTAARACPTDPRRRREGRCRWLRDGSTTKWPIAARATGPIDRDSNGASDRIVATSFRRHRFGHSAAAAHGRQLLDVGTQAIGRTRDGRSTYPIAFAFPLAGGFDVTEPDVHRFDRPPSLTRQSMGGTGEKPPLPCIDPG
uniref:Uncharacterized protein n=1 Tax=Trichuris muris TaxID=70415 RepID=A0A5S6QVD9_TRIMR